MPTLFNLTMLFLMEVLTPARAASLQTAAAPPDAAAPQAAAGSGGSTSYQERIALEQDADGYDRQEIHGQPCADGYTRGGAAAMLSGSGLCMVAGWASDDPQDCRVQVRLREEAGESGVCVVTVFELPR